MFIDDTILRIIGNCFEGFLSLHMTSWINLYDTGLTGSLVSFHRGRPTLHDTGVIQRHSKEAFITDKLHCRLVQPILALGLTTAFWFKHALKNLCAKVVFFCKGEWLWLLYISKWMLWRNIKQLEWKFCKHTHTHTTCNSGTTKARYYFTSLKGETCSD